MEVEYIAPYISLWLAYCLTKVLLGQKLASDALALTLFSSLNFVAPLRAQVMFSTATVKSAS